MKINLSIVAAIIIGAIFYFIISYTEKVHFTLLESETNLPIKNQDIEISEYQMVYDAPPILNILAKQKTDEMGNFSIPKRVLNNREIGINCGSKYRMVVFSVKDNHLWLRKFRNSFFNVLEVSHYDLENKIEKTEILHKDSIIRKYDRIKVYVNDKEIYQQIIRRKLKERKTEFELDQTKLWEFIWNEFNNSVTNEVTPPHNCNIWYTLVVSSWMIELDLEIAFQEAKKIKDLNKMYYHLYALCGMINYRGGLKDPSEKKIVNWIDEQVYNFYKMTPHLELGKRNYDLPMDYLSSAYLTMKKNIKKINIQK